MPKTSKELDLALRGFGNLLVKELKLKVICNWLESSKFIKYINRSILCKHKFDLDDLLPRVTPDGGVSWPCWKCGKVFKAHCGLDILNHGTCTKKLKGSE